MITRANVILNCNLDINHSLSMKSSMSIEENNEREIYWLMGYKIYYYKIVNTTKLTSHTFRLDNNSSGNTH